MWLCVFGVAARSVTHDLVNSSRSFHTDWAGDDMDTGQVEVDRSLVVRRLRADDVDVFRKVRLDALEESPDAFGETLQDARTADWQLRTNSGALFADRAVFIAIADSLPVGMVFVKCASHPETAFLGGMWVRPEFRRRGLGRSLVQDGLDFLRKADQTELSLWVTHDHVDVFAFYRSLGFRETGVTDTLRPGSNLLIHELRYSLR